MLLVFSVIYWVVETYGQLKKRVFKCLGIHNLAKSNHFLELQNSTTVVGVESSSGTKRASLLAFGSLGSSDDIVYTPPDIKQPHNRVVFANEVSVFAYHNKDPVRPDLFQKRKEGQLKFRQLVQQKVIGKQKQILTSWHNLVTKAKENSKQENISTGLCDESVTGNERDYQHVTKNQQGSPATGKLSYKERWRKIVEQKIISRQNMPVHPVFAQHLDEELMEVRRSANSSPKFFSGSSSKFNAQKPQFQIDLDQNNIKIEMPAIHVSRGEGKLPEEVTESMETNFLQRSNTSTGAVLVDGGTQDVSFQKLFVFS